MKTKLVRPILVKPEDINNIYNLLLTPKNKLTICNTGAEYRRLIASDCIPKQIVLVSPDDKIETGDTFYTPIGNHVTMTWNENYSFPHQYIPGCKKVIATRTQIPTNYIYKFIDEYNKSNIKDLYIEIEETDNPKFNRNKGVCKSNPTYLLIPKLTNGFVIIVEKEPEFIERSYSKEDMIEFGLLCNNDVHTKHTKALIASLLNDFNTSKLKSNDTNIR